MTDTYDWLLDWLDRAGRAGGRATVAWWRTAKRSPRGLANLVVAAKVWVFPTYADAVPKNAAEAQAREKRSLIRGCAVVVGVVAAWIAVAMMLPSLQPGWLFWPVFAGVLFVLGMIGAHATGGGAPDDGTLTPEQTEIRRMLCSVFRSIRTAADADPAALTVGKAVTDWATGVRAISLAMPYGTTASDLARHPEAIATAIARATNKPVAADQIAVEAGDNPGQAVIYIAPVRPGDRTAPPWQLASADRHDITKPVHIGENLDGHAPVGLRLFSRDSDGDLQAHHAIVFGETGSGKSNLTRLLVLAAIMDRAATVCVAQKEGSKDFRRLRGSLDWLGDITDREGVRAMLQRAVDHMRQVRAGQVPETPYLVVLEEAQNVLSGRKQWADAEIVQLTRTLLAEGRDAAICLVIVTQRPVSSSLDQEIAQRPPNRLAFTVNGSTDAEMAMGAKLNDRNTPMKAPQFAVGVHINGDLDARVLVPEVGGTEAARIAKAHPREKLHDAQETPVDPFPTTTGDDTPQAAQEARTVDLAEVRAAWPEPRDLATMPELCDRMPGGWEPTRLAAALQAAGITPRQLSINGNRATWAIHRDDLEPSPESILDHLDAVWLPGWDRGIHCTDLVAMLTERYPSLYAGLTVPAMNAQLRDEGLKPAKGVRVADKTGTGVYWADLQAARGGVVAAGKQGST